MPERIGTSASTRLVRCAIYTRTSTDERLSLELNSLEVQREACSAFVESQRHEGWRTIRKRYDDGGFSGGTLKRPALSRLLDDVAIGEVDTIVVYKIDRLTRSLADFAKIMDALNASGASFVSVTQAFNTQHSMGRLTLNVLLSFAQFERELGGERVRDRIAAAKARGLWTGGTVPLGYNTVDRRLVPNVEEARIVRHIFDTYLRLGSVTETAATLQAEGVRTKIQTMGRGRRRGGNAFGTGALRYLLGNELYAGKVGRGALRHGGQHSPIVDPAIWEQVQDKLRVNAFRQRCGHRSRDPSLLAGLVHDLAGRRMSPACTRKRNKRYRYYCSNQATLAADADPQWAARVWRVPAAELEGAVRIALGSTVIAPPVPQAWVTARGAPAWQDWAAAGRATAGLLREGRVSDLREILLRIRLRITVAEDHLVLLFSRVALAQVVAREPVCQTGEPSVYDEARLRIPADVRKRGRSIALALLPEGSTRRNPALIRLICAAFAARDRLMTGGEDLDASSRRELTRTARFSYLAPDIVEAILTGEQPLPLTARGLRRAGKVPLRWSDQRSLFGFPDAAGAEASASASAAMNLI
jgi:DNA invertase Pin-like site-specific DNA recombinase